MAWLAVDNDSSEWIFGCKPCRNKLYKTWEVDYNNNYILDIIELPKDSIEKLIGRKLTWEDEPVEII